MPAPSYMSSKRRKCFYFDDSGQPREHANGITVGCPRGSKCIFAHPQDVEWASASPSRPPPGVKNSLRHRTPSPPPRRDYRPTDRRFNSSLSRDRDNVEMADIRYRRELSTHGRAPERSPARSPASADVHEAPPRSRLGSRTSPHPTSNGYERRMADLSALESRKRRTPPSPPSMPPSLLPTKLPPNGNPPQGIEPYRPSPTKELTVEEKHAAWVERVRLMSEAVVTRSEHLRLQKELQSYQRLTQSRRFVEIPEEARVQMDAQSADVMRQCEEKKQALNAIVAQLTGADVWPAEPLGQRILDGSPAEMKASIIELKANVQHIFDALRKAAPTVGSDTKLVDTMDPQLSPHQGPPAKRRRLSPALNQLSLAVSSGDKAQLGSNALDEVMDLLRKFESRLSDLENDMIQHDNDLLEEVEGRIQNKLEGLQSDHSLPLLSSSEPGGQIQAVVAAEQQPALDVPQGRKLEEFRQEVDTLGEQVGELAQEVANLILEMRAKDEEAQRLRQDNELLMQEVDALKRQQQQNQDAIEESRQEIRALSAAVTAHLSHSADPPPIPQVPEMETIVAAVEPVVLQSVREDMKPLLDGMHTTIDNMLQDQKSQVYATVLSKMSTTIKTVEVVSDWMERIRKGEQSVERPDATDHDGNVQKNTDVSV